MKTSLLFTSVLSFATVSAAFSSESVNLQEQGAARNTILALKTGMTCSELCLDEYKTCQSYCKEVSDKQKCKGHCSKTLSECQGAIRGVRVCN